MATLVWQPNVPNCLSLHRNGVERRESKFYYPVDNELQRPGYLRKIGTSLLLHTCSQSDMKCLQDNRTTPEEMRNFFGIKGDEEHKVYIEDVDPWLCISDRCDLIMYFGKDKPIRKQKTVKTNTKHRRTWENWYNRHVNNTSISTYNYWYVKDPSKLLIFSTHLGYVESVFPELPYKSIPLETKQPICKNEPFKCSDNYDYTDSEKQEIFRKEEEERLRKKKEVEELERRKSTPGFCSRCGAKYAAKVQNPFEYDMNGRIVYEWLCRDCYHSILGDI